MCSYLLSIFFSVYRLETEQKDTHVEELGLVAESKILK